VSASTIGIGALLSTERAAERPSVHPSTSSGRTGQAVQSLEIFHSCWACRSTHPTFSAACSGSA